ncbi:MAG: hypothetical protein A3K60_04780 [Euryarchaeota archaeon RBG_19FT_COMBO_56_21]|nr:MAG: hypothetical protein A3K60_04780 [Euryarchaeota archaeon RBG_19FT_COMBO_56_21]
MIAVTHLVVSLLLIELMHLDRNDAFVALVFGVFIDLDHLFGLRDYVRANGVTAVFDLGDIVNPGGHWKSLMHSPVAVMVVGPVSIASRLAVPLLFWGTHLLMDIAQVQVLGVLSSQESVFLFLAAAGLVTIRYARCIATGSASTLAEYLRFEIGGMKAWTRPRMM